ncbi:MULTISPECIES: hypothetical protein [Prochlorococcus]|uniref:hypothetical protein n=1 Tax=Prochlorococcus TaxID=1218 RepID=UPI0005613862|nr:MULTISPECIES: hypothetical protein [Prochlorococcus]
MAGIKEHDYLKVCAELASCLSISIAAASKKIDIVAAKQGAKDLASRKKVAQLMLDEARALALKGESSITSQLDTLLEALAEEENFLVED